MNDPLDITDRPRLVVLLEALKRGDARRINEPEMKAALRRRVRGQDHVIDDLARFLRLQFAKEERKKPVANLLFVGPTGTGKTELTRALAEYLYGDEKNLIIYDCAEFTGPESKHRLIGVPRGYHGADSGGELTRRMLNNPQQLIVFDEIEKAWPGIFDLFLSIMGEGRLTEQASGKTADFTRAVLILASNAEYEAACRIQEQVDDPYQRTNALKQQLSDSKVFRPEIVGRLDRVYVFKPLDGLVSAEIVALKMGNLARQYGLELRHVAPELIVEAMQNYQKQKDFGVRALDGVVNDLLGEPLLAAREGGATRIAVRVAEDGALRVEPA